MTTPYERTRALVQTRNFLQRLASLGEDAIPISLLNEAEALLRHYPQLAKIELVHKALPMFFGSVTPYTRLAGTADVQGTIDPTKDGVLSPHLR